MSRRQAVPPSNRYNTTFLKASQFVETDEAYKGNAIQDRKIQDRGTQINFRLNLKRDFSFLLQLKFLDGLTAFFLNRVFSYFFFSLLHFFSLFFLHVLCRHFATCYVLHAFLYTTLVCMYKLSVLQFYLSHCKSLFFFLKHSAFRFLAGYFKLLHSMFPGWSQYNTNIIIYQ